MGVIWEKHGAAALSVGLILVAAVAVFWPVLAQEGWPFNHEHTTFGQRTQIIAAHFSMGDYVPLWSSVDSLGLGSPMPILYHKLFYYISALVLVISGGVKVSIVATLVLFAMIGGVGVYLALRRVGVSHAISTAASIAFLFANYTTTNWLVRGAMAEFSAAMLIPFAVLWVFILLKERRWALWIGPLLAGVALGHSVLAYYVAFFLAIGFVLHTAAAPAQAFSRATLLPALVSVGIFGVILAPFAGPGLLMARNFDLSVILSRGYVPETTMRPLNAYFWDTDWHWGVEYSGLTTEIGLPILLTLLAGFLILPMLRRAPAYGAHIPVIAFLCVGLAVCLFLQTPASLPVYQFIPGLRYIQFPWRLLAVLTPLAVMLVAVIGSLLPRRVGASAVWAMALATVVLSGVFRPIYFNWHGAQELEAPLSDRVRLSIGGEYFPRTLDTDIAVTFERLKIWADHKAVLQTGPCTVKAADLPVLEVLTRRFTVQCTDQGRALFPVIHSGLEQAWRVENGARVFVPTSRTPDEPRSGANLGPGRHQIEIDLPTYRALFR